jgi:hypothetical protein
VSRVRPGTETWELGRKDPGPETRESDLGITESSEPRGQQTAGDRPVLLSPQTSSQHPAPSTQHPAPSPAQAASSAQPRRAGSMKRPCLKFKLLGIEGGDLAAGVCTCWQIFDRKYRLASRVAAGTKDASRLLADPHLNIKYYIILH